MFSRIADAGTRTAATRIALGSTVAFAIGTAIAFAFLLNFVANDIQSRSDAWLTGELAVLAEVATGQSGSNAHETLVQEVSELASREAPGSVYGSNLPNRSVFFLQTSADGALVLHTGAGDGPADLEAIQRNNLVDGPPENVSVPGFHLPFRVAVRRLNTGERVYLALSTRYERLVLHRLWRTFAIIWVAMIVLGTAIVYFSTRRMLRRVQAISETAAIIGQTNLSSRVPASGRNDEIARLTSIFNQMLDRIQAAVQQLHTMSDSLAHDLRSPLTSTRAKLELALMSSSLGEKEEAIVHAVEDLDRMSVLLSTSLDVAEANADALRIRKETVSLDETLQSLVELYEPSFAQCGLKLRFQVAEPVRVEADPVLLQRTLTNLFDNELKHAAPATVVTVNAQQRGSGCVLTLEDDGCGFPEEILPRIFERHVKGPASNGHGLGLAFVAAVVRSHNGQIAATNPAGGGARITLQLP